MSYSSRFMNWRKCINAKEFAELFYIEKGNMMKYYFDKSNSTKVGIAIENLELSTEQMDQMEKIIDTVITDVMYSVLVGLDGGASIGTIQQTYMIYDEDGQRIESIGDIEQYAYEYFQEEKN